MNKTKRLLLILVAVFSFLMFTDVNAISKELIEENSKITVPSIISSSGTTVTVNGTEDYELFAQWIEITMDNYNSLKEKTVELNNIRSEFNDFNEENYPNEDQYETEDEYNEAVKEYNAKVDEYKAKYNDAETELYELFPDFDDTKWEKLVDDKVYLPEASYTGTKPFVIYLKLDDKENSIIDYAVNYLKLNGEESENIKFDNSKWEKLKAGIKKNETIGLFDNEEYGITFYETDIKESTISNEAAFTIKIKEKATDKEFNITLNYKALNSTYAVVSYETSTGEPEGFEMVHSMVMYGVMEEITEIFGYNYEAFMKWLMENEGKLTLTGNGIEYEMKEYDYSSKGEGYDFALSGDYFSKLNVNINSPITGYTDPKGENVKDESKEENANTGDLNIIVFSGITLICLGLGAVAYRKIKLN